ncbi:hypothetical protein SAMN05421544_105111 [Riemerella columbipharyngis]|uniref:DUF6973 domain-containing protein n=2 Tax=Riemerella columbipharyngis TaxID=1071918 RepID=A0A1G7BE23_9FLAO|nr:hypothetical protein SAMN05421544_105111 [Riemerella columbipharyngis]
MAFYATIKAYKIAEKNYPKTASNDGKGNAFRHALWCCLIMMYCCKISSPQKSLKFCEKITNLHEELFPNPLLEREMDLHNNKIGMDYFMTLLPSIHRQFFETSFFIDELKSKTEKAVAISSLEDNFGEGLVYIDKENIA